ncbi:hypothetical protein CPC08DRAFT_697234 [Agrocybe pediades]|nr:hypothetical protein CPC08DRAFT_697234 [Agrocybe pediades]
MDLIVDDRDPRIVYSAGQWQTTGTINEFDSSTTCSNVVGATATIRFSGNVSVTGTIGAAANGAAPRSSYSVDGTTPNTFTAVQGDTVKYSQVFFSDVIWSGSHTLVITNLEAQALYCIDFISLSPIPLVPIPPSVDSPVLTSPLLLSTTASLSVSPQNPSSSGASSSSSILNTISSSAMIPGSITSSITLTSKVTPKSLTRLHTKFRTRSSAIIASTSIPAEQTGSGSHERLSSGVAAGIAVGIIAAVVVSIAILCFVGRQRRRHSSRIVHGSLWTSHLPPPSESTLSPFILRNEAPLNWSPKNEKDELRKQGFPDRLGEGEGRAGPRKANR